MTLRRVNDILLIAIILVNAYVLIAPHVPKIVYWWQENHSNRQAELAGQLATPAPKPDPAAPAPAAANHLVIPSMLLDEPTFEGSIANTYKTLDKGIWRWPKGSTPDKGGNTVFLGHRFTYTKPKGVFYFLNKVQKGDQIGLFWEGKRYLYRVSEVKVVSPNETSILAPTDDSRLTIYTCTPLWSPKDRLVIVAQLEES